MRTRWVLCAAWLFFGASAAQAVEILEPPTLTMDPNGTTPLAGVVELLTDVSVQASLTITDGQDIWTVDFPAAQDHYLPVLGLKSNRSYTVGVDLTPGGFAGSLGASTPALPADFPDLTLLASNAPLMEPGYTLLGRFGRGGSSDPRPTYTIIVDDQGDVVWYAECCAGGVIQLPNGDLFWRSTTGVRQQDLLGNITLDVPLVTPALHHDLVRTPAGTYFSVTRESVQVPDYPTSDTDPFAPPAPATVRDDPVVEFFPDGSLREKWPLMDLLDRTRIGYDSLRSTSFGLDWAHANAVFYDAATDSVVVSVRHQDAVIKFSRATGGLIWILGPHDNWMPAFMPFLLTPVGTPFRWQYHQHASMVTDGGTLMLFDNGNSRASPFDGNPRLPDSLNFSRGVEFDIDEQAMTVTQIWEWGENIPETLYTNRISDSDPMETTGNVLMTFGAVSYVDGQSSPSLGLGIDHARIIEVTSDPSPQTVFDLRVHDASNRITIYRSERIPGLYPQTYLQAPNGVGNTLLAAKNGNEINLTWAAAHVDAFHSAAEYYIVYASSSANSGFAMTETSAQTSAGVTSTEPLQFYRIVAANLAGTSGDEP